MIRVETEGLKDKAKPSASQGSQTPDLFHTGVLGLGDRNSAQGVWGKMGR